MHFNRNLKFYIKEVKKAIKSKNRGIINKDIYEYKNDDIVNHEDKIKANEEVGTVLNQESKTTNSKFLTTGASIHNNNLMLMDIKKNNTNNLDKIEIYSNEQDKNKEAIKEGKSNIKKKEKNNIYEYDSSYLPNSSFEVVSYNCHEHIIEISHMKFEFIYIIFI